MNNVLVKILCGLFIITTISSDATASGKDTTRLLADNNNISSPSLVTITKVANIVYPESIEEDKPQFIKYVQKYSNKKRDFLLEMFEKGKKYFPKVEIVLKKYNLPQELKVLVALESGFKANAVSRAGAVGYWQMMDEAARDYGLHISGNVRSGKDERTNLIKSTNAAAKYLSDHAIMLNNDILLMVASYNCGMGNVRRAIKKSGKKTPDFWDIKKYLPLETRNYVMNFISLSVIFANFEKFENKNLLFYPQSVVIPVSNNNVKLNTAITN